METKEKSFSGFKMSGFVMILVQLLLMAACVYGFTTENEIMMVLSGIVVLCCLISFAGYLQLEPNEAKVLVFFGKYKGTFRGTGLFWINPFITQKKLSMRARNLDVEPIKVNDKIGNPILIGLVLVWRVKDTYKAMFEIDAQTMATAGGATAKVNNNDIRIGGVVASR
jgi:regulator of protease activity HflC (stomatin/prohibitin superfamily)